MEQRLCESAIEGNVESLREITKQDALILDRIVVGCFNGKSPLHVATSCGKAQFVQELLRLKPELAEVMDSDGRSALHLASAKGHAEIVQDLANVSPDIGDMCLVRDREGNIPLHIAAAKGKVDVLDRLLQTCRRSARVRLDRDGSTVLHLCVKNNKLNTLKLLLQRMKGEEFVNAKDNDGNTILHLAVLDKNLEFVKELLRLEPELAEVLDSDRRSALHLASAKGHAEIVEELAIVSPDMCLARDRDGNIPLHIAAAKGKVDVLDCLLRMCRRSARVRLDRDGSTVLHLCVKHDKLNTLELLLQQMRSEEFVNGKDNDGNTILHLAVLDKQLEIIMHVLKNSKIDVNAKNASGHTAMDFLFLADEGSESKDLDGKIEDFLRQANAKRGNDLIHGDWLAKKRDALMIVASLIATMAFQAGVNPPGGVWQEDSEKHKAGEAVMASNFANSYPYFLRSNTIGFVASLSTILLLISGLPFKSKGFMWILVMIMWLAITSMAFSYAFANIVVTPKIDRDLLRKTIEIAAIVWCKTIEVAVIVWCGVMTLNLLVRIVRYIAGVLKERWRRTQAIDRISKLT